MYLLVISGSLDWTIEANMIPFYITWILLFASTGCMSQSEPPKTPSNSDVDNLTRSDTYLPTNEINHIWTIHQFRFHENLKAIMISSPYLHAPTTDRYEWRIDIYPNGEDNNNVTIGVYVCISNHSTVNEVTAEANISIINNKKEPLHHRHVSPGKYVRGADLACWGFA